MQQARGRSRQTAQFDDVQAWMARRWADLERREREPANAGWLGLTEPVPLQGLVAVEAEELPELGAPEGMDLGLRFQLARPGDSISELTGSSDPAAIGKFLSLNGMDGRSSTLHAGRNYIVPTRWDDATRGETGVGEALLRSDGARLRADKRAAADRQVALLLERRNIWTGEPVDAARGARSPAPRAGKPRRGHDDDPLGRSAVGVLGWGLGILPGAVRGGVGMIKGAGEGANFVYQLTNPSLPGHFAREQLLSASRGAGGYVMRGIEDPSLVRRDIAGALLGFELKHNPFSTPPADSLQGEFKRTFDIGMNNGELAFDVGSLLLGGGAIRGAAGMGAAAKAPGAKELAYLAANPGLAARFDLPYSGMGHHIVERSTRLPQFLGGGRLPDWFLESKFNKIREDQITTRDHYRNHNGAAGHLYGAAIPKRFGGGSWSAKNLSWTNYGPLDKLNYGTFPYTKAVVGPILLGGTTTDAFDAAGRR